MKGEAFRNERRLVQKVYCGPSWLVFVAKIEAHGISARNGLMNSRVVASLEVPRAMRSVCTVVASYQQRLQAFVPRSLFWFEEVQGKWVDYCVILL